MIELTEKPIDIERIREAVADPSCGAVVLFEGRVRDHHDGKVVVGLEYEVYPKMVLRVFDSICEQAKQKWHITKVAVIHRYGRLRIGDVAVVVAVASAHRKEAFDAASFIMDAVKKEAPIWKKEFYPDGSVQWVGCSHAPSAKEIGGGLLAGGESRRFGENKALAVKEKKPFYRIALDLLERFCAEVRVSSNEPRLYTRMLCSNDPPHLFGRTSYEVVPDEVKRRGPLAGVAALLKKSFFPSVLILACDMPNVTDEVVETLIEELNATTKFICFQENGRLHPFPGLFHRDLIGMIEGQLLKGLYRVEDFIALIPKENKKIIDVGQLKTNFINVNTKEEYLKL